MFFAWDPLVTVVAWSSFALVHTCMLLSVFGVVRIEEPDDK